MKRIKRPRLMVGLTIGFVLLLGVIFSDKVITANAHIEGWVVTTPVAIGTTLTSADVKSIAVPVGGDHFNVFTQNPVGRRVSVPLQPGDLLTASLLGASTTSIVPLNVHMAPSLSAGSTVDIYAVVSGQTVLLARHMVVESTNPLSILVPDQQEPQWMSVAGSSTILILAQSTGVGVPTANLSVLQSIQKLSSESAAPGSGENLAAIPPATASPSPTSSPSPSQGG